MRIGVIGAGYVGLVTGTCLAEMGNDVVVVDIDPEKVKTLETGHSPHFEPGLEELLQRNIKDGRLHFSLRTAEAVTGANAVFLAVGTPMSDDGAADLSYIEQAAGAVAEALDGYCALIIKSTVPVGTNRRLADLVDKHARHEFDMISNPEFLKEGAAVDDFMRPDRVVVGVRSDRAAHVMRQIYDPFLRTGHPIMEIDPESAEMVKYTSNALLASRISFMNEMAAICTAVGADIELVRKGVGADHRIGQAFLFPGLGYGGSCFPKDVRALAKVAERLELPAPMCKAIDAVNVRQRGALDRHIVAELGRDLNGKRFGVWGLAFKPRTDDVREAPAIYLIEDLLARGAAVTAYDPEATETARKELGDRIGYAANRYEAAAEADALVVCTEWNEFRSPDFERLATTMKRPLLFDGRNLYDLEIMRRHRFTYYSIGRPAVVPETVSS